MAEITYLMGSDSGANKFYTLAKKYFEQEQNKENPKQSVIVDAPADGQTLEGVFDDLRTRAAKATPQVFPTINLVTHATGLSSVMFSLEKAKAKDQYTGPAALTNANAAALSKTPLFKPPGSLAVTPKTHIRIYGCDIGRDEKFVRALGTLFVNPADTATGNPADISAPVRVAIFRFDGTNYVYRLARTWSVIWPRAIAHPPPSPATAAAFVTAAMTKFGPEAMMRSTDPIPDDRPTKQLIEAAVAAVANDGGGFWLDEQSSIAIPPAEEANAQAYVNTVSTQNSAVLPPSLPVDDTNVRLTVAAADYVKESAKLWVAHIAMLGQRIESAVNFTDSSMYNTIKIDPPKAPTPGPKPVPPAAGAPPPALTEAPQVWDGAVEAFLAAGGAQNDIDDLLAALDAAPVEPLEGADFEVAEVDAEPVEESA